MKSELIGAPQEAIDTPHLLLDLDILDQNIQAMSAYCSQNGCQWRPHSKAHKCPQIAHLQLAAGAIGITCAKLGEAELMVQHGINHILLANQLSTPTKWARLAVLQKQAEVIASIDDETVIPQAEEAALAHATRIPLVIEVDVGMGRVGVVEPKDILKLARRIQHSDSLELCGLMGYEGHVLAVEPAKEKEVACKEAVGRLLQARDLLLENGIACPIISAGGTGSYRYTAAIPGVTEVQAGGGIFMDAKYRDEFHVEGLDIALRLVASVTSRRPGQIVTDSGFKSLSAHHGLPHVLTHSGIDLAYLSAEHGVFRVADGIPLPALGSRVELALGYTDSTTFLHDVFWGVRGGVVESILPILGRGRLT